MEPKSDCALGARLYVASQTREGGTQEFLTHENHTYLPSWSSSGKLKHTHNSDQLDSSRLTKVANTPRVDLTVMDGAAVVHFLPIGESKTFAE